MKLNREQRERLARHLQQSIIDWWGTEDHDEFMPNIEKLYGLEYTRILVECPQMNDLPILFTIHIESEK